MSAPTTTTADLSSSPLRTKPGRMLSLDVLRGLDIGFMILVNDNGDGARAYWALKHADWNGFTPTDLVFPTFLFLVGISTVFSTEARLAQGATKQSIFLHTVRRAVILFLFGLLVNSFPNFSLHTLRFYGVLPRIAICYFIVATLYLISPGWRSKAVLVVAALGAYWVLMRYVPVPGYGLPGRDVPFMDRDADLAAWIDRHIFSASHLYERTRDPEGLLSTIPAVATALIGMLTGIWLRTGRSIAEKARGIAIAGCAGVLPGGLWSFSFPLNKKLWTSSFVLFAGGLSLLLLAVSIWLVDILRAPEGSPDRARRSKVFMPLLVFGTNAIAAYVLSELLASGIDSIRLHSGENLQRWLYHSILAAVPHPAFASLLYSLGYVAVCWIPIYLLYRRRIFIKI
jgi:predicted acyltransferase